MKDVKLVCEHGQPYGIRDWTGFLVFFHKVQKFNGQEERYRKELAEKFALADDLEAFLKLRTPAEDSTGEAQITQWACGGCGATVNGRQNYCPECGGTLTKGDKDCNGHCNCQQRGQ